MSEIKVYRETGANARTWANRLTPICEVLEVQAAKAIFLKKMRCLASLTDLTPGDFSLYMSPSETMANALAEVWKQGREYQLTQDRDKLLKLVEAEARA